MKINSSTTTNNVCCFSSLDMFRDAHRNLLKQYRERDITPVIAKEIEDFIDRGRTIGALLEDEEERWDAQSRLDYWAAILQRSGHEVLDSILCEFNPDIELDCAIERVSIGETMEEDLQLLRNTISTKAAQDIVQVGKYNIHINEGQDIQIGDKIYQGANAEAIRQTLSELLAARQFRTLLTHAEFADRIERSALTSYKVPMIGRDAILQELQQAKDGDRRVIILHGAAGLGKTRLLLEITNFIGNQQALWYVRNEAESIESELTLLDANKQHIIIVDDAHRFNLLPQLRELFINSKFADKITLILATRTAFQASVIDRLNISIDRVSSIEISPLENKDIDEILQNPPYQITNQDLRYTIVRIAERNPLIAGITARLSRQGISLANLSRDEVLTQYLDNIVNNLVIVDGHDRQNATIYIRYLQILAALGTINLNEENVRAKLNEVVGITSIDEELIILRLIEAGLVERYWQTLKLTSEVLADYILVRYFFNSKTKQANYHKLIIEPFFNLKPREVLTSLAEAEFKGNSSEAGSLLTNKLNELTRALSREGNLFRLNLLHSLREVAYLRPDNILVIVDFIVEAPVAPAETIQDKLWGSYTIDHSWVLTEAVEVLSRTIYRGRSGDTIAYLHKLARYQPQSQEYDRVREKATKALIEIANFKLRKPYKIQLHLLEQISNWLEKDSIGNLPLSLVLIEPMLKIDFSSAEMHPIEANQLSIWQVSLDIVDYVREIRDRALEILCHVYQRESPILTRLQIIGILCGATYYSSPRDSISTQTREQLEVDCARIAGFFSEIVVPIGEFPILERILEWLRQAKKFHKYQAVEIDYLYQQILNHKSYQLYRLLVGGYRWEEENRLDWQPDPKLFAEQIIQTDKQWEVDRERKQKEIRSYVEAISSSNLERVIQELETIVQQSKQVDKNGLFGLNDLLRFFGQNDLSLAQQFIDLAMARNSELKQHLGFVLAGIYDRDRDVAKTYIRDWMKREDAVLWVAISCSYRFIDWSQPQLEEELNMLSQLIAKQDLIVDRSLFWPIQELASYNSDLVVELLKTLATRNDENTLNQVAEIVSFQRSNDEWIITFDNPQDLEEIINNFARLSRLDYNAEQCLKRLCDTDPMKVIDLIERRINLKSEKSVNNTYYEAFPQPFSYTFDNIHTQPEYPIILRRLRGWLLTNDLRWLEAPILLKEVNLNLTQELQNILREWITTGDEKKLQGVARVLSQFNAGQSFYDLSRELIVCTSNEYVHSTILAAIGSTPDVVIGSMSHFYKRRIEEVTPWLNDNEFKVRQFGEQVLQSMQSSLDWQEAQEKLEQRNW
jgi:Effector-associated domain 10